MFIRLKGRAVPLALLVIASLWMALVIYPLFYSSLFPNPDIQHIVRAFEGKETLRADLAALADATISSGPLKRAIPVAAYLGASAEYKHGESHRTKTAELCYLAWFEKRAKPTILVITRTETDGSRVHFEVSEDTPLDILRSYLLPAVVLAISIYWFLRKRRVQPRTEPTDQPLDQ